MYHAEQSNIHPTAHIEHGAQIDPSAQIGPFCTVSAGAVIGAHTQLMAHVVIEGDTTLGSGNRVHPFAVLGGAPQDLKYQGEPSRLRIGDNNVIRESATLNRGTEAGSMETQVGSGCLLMAYTHVAHDCVVGDGVILANSVALCGHVRLDEQVIVGALVGIHQFCHVGAHAFVAMGSVLTQDAPPFGVVQGDRAQWVGVNTIGLQRRGWDAARVKFLCEGYRILFQARKTRLEALKHLEEMQARGEDPHGDIAQLCTFIRASSRGICAAPPVSAHAPGAGVKA